MDISTIPSPAHPNGGCSYHSQISVDEHQSQSFSSQDYDQDWDYDDKHNMATRKRCMTYPYVDDSSPRSSPLVAPNNLAFGRHYSLFASKGLSNESLLPMQVKEYNRKHDSSMNLEMDSLEVFIDVCICSH